jgi:hypothetical protein
MQQHIETLVQCHVFQGSKIHQKQLLLLLLLVFLCLTLQIKKVLEFTFRKKQDGLGLCMIMPLLL